jgi:hypothetical protein
LPAGRLASATAFRKGTVGQEFKALRRAAPPSLRVRLSTIYVPSGGISVCTDGPWGTTFVESCVIQERSWFTNVALLDYDAILHEIDAAVKAQSI